MKPDELNAMAAIAQTALAALTLAGTVVVSLFVYYGSHRIAKTQYLRSVYDAWLRLDIFLLSNPHHLQAFNKIARPDHADASEEETAKVHVTFLILNPLSSYFYGVKNGYISDDLSRVEARLAVLLEDEDVFTLTQQEVFGKEFKTFCKAVRKKHWSHAKH